MIRDLDFIYQEASNCTQESFSDLAWAIGANSKVQEIHGNRPKRTDLIIRRLVEYGKELLQHRQRTLDCEGGLQEASCPSVLQYALASRQRETMLELNELLINEKVIASRLEKTGSNQCHLNAKTTYLDFKHRFSQYIKVSERFLSETNTAKLAAARGPRVLTPERAAGR